MLKKGISSYFPLFHPQSLTTRSVLIRKFLSVHFIRRYFPSRSISLRTKSPILVLKIFRIVLPLLTHTQFQKSNIVIENCRRCQAGNYLLLFSNSCTDHFDDSVRVLEVASNRPNVCHCRFNKRLLLLQNLKKSPMFRKMYSNRQLLTILKLSMALFVRRNL